ncbi:MAG: hypothetical protein U0Q15_02540 [Kineosporiaceae bacterium]
MVKQRWARPDLLLLAAAIGAFLAAWTLPRPARVVSVVPCVDAPGPLRWAGLHLSVLSESRQCPTGQLALQAPGHPALITVMVIVPLLLGYLLGAAGLFGCWALVRAAVVTVGRLVARLWHPVDAPAQHAVPARAAVPAAASSWAPGRLPALPIARRGPPALLFAR